jgi:hypothetical protein
VPNLIHITDQNAAQGLIDATSSLRNGRFWLFSGTANTAVPQRIMNDLKPISCDMWTAALSSTRTISRYSTPSQLTFSAIRVMC